MVVVVLRRTSCHVHIHFRFESADCLFVWPAGGDRRRLAALLFRRFSRTRAWSSPALGCNRILSATKLLILDSVGWVQALDTQTRKSFVYVTFFNLLSRCFQAFPVPFSTYLQKLIPKEASLILYELRFRSNLEANVLGPFSVEPTPKNVNLSTVFVYFKGYRVPPLSTLVCVVFAPSHTQP